MADSIAFGSSALGITTAIATKAEAYISSLQKASEDFHDLVFQFRQAKVTVSKISNFLSELEMPEIMMAECTQDLRLRLNEFEDIGRVLRAISTIPRPTKATSVFSRMRQRSTLASGDLESLTNRLHFFNQHLLNMVSAYQSRIVLEAHRNVTGVGGADRSAERDVGFRYGPTVVVASMQNDGWEDERDYGPVSRQSSWAYEGQQRKSRIGDKAHQQPPPTAQGPNPSTPPPPHAPRHPALHPHLAELPAPPRPCSRGSLHPSTPAPHPHPAELPAPPRPCSRGSLHPSSPPPPYAPLHPAPHPPLAVLPAPPRPSSRGILHQSLVENYYRGSTGSLHHAEQLREALRDEWS